MCLAIIPVKNSELANLPEVTQKDLLIHFKLILVIQHMTLAIHEVTKQISMFDFSDFMVSPCILREACLLQNG